MLLATISFETSLADAMPDDTPDPLYVSPFTETIFDSEEHEPMLPTTTTDINTTDPADFAPLTSDPAFAYPPPKRPSDDAAQLPPREPIMTLTLSHIYHRLVTPTPVPPTRPLDLEELEDTIRRLALPLHNAGGAPRAVSRMLEILGRARERQRERLRREQGEASSSEGGTGTESGSSGGSGTGTTASSGERSSSTRIPGAIIDDDEEN